MKSMRQRSPRDNDLSLEVNTAIIEAVLNFRAETNTLKSRELCQTSMFFWPSLHTICSRHGNVKTHGQSSTIMDTQSCQNFREG